ncbi:MAG: hypothetical protein M3N33_02425 [Actinomycetota bacterium]|nr:hypothetical protein [Actinomycetota bacterium]
MREKVAPFYWAAAGALSGFGLIGLMTIGGPFLLAGVVLALVGLPLLWTKGIWALFVGFGGLPALVFLLHIINGARTALNPYCAQMGEPGALVAGAADPGPVSVSFVPASYYVMFAVFAAVALFGVALGRLLRRPGHRTASSS